MAKTDDQVIDKLDLILRILSIQVAVNQSVTERVRLLKLAGLDNQTIADVLNTSTATVRTLASNLRVRKKAKKK